MDWNNDGKKDLLTGENSGNIRIYLNTGTDAAPAFSGHTLLNVGGSIFDAGAYSVPYVTDWNSDGLFDLICGESNGWIHFLLNRGTPGNPLFVGKVYLQDGAGKLDAGTTISPAVCDFNRDGKKDLLVGESNGRILYYENVGTDEKPAFNGYKYLQSSGGAIIDVWYYARIFVADWDNDGIMDVLSGNRNYNTGEPAGAVWFFDAFDALQASEDTLTASTGGKVEFDLNASPDHGNRLYLIFGSVTGTEPGLPLSPGVTIPINWDPFTQLLISLLSSPALVDFTGNLDADGKAAAALDSLGPIPPDAVGLVMSFAYACMDYPFDFASNAVNVEILP